MSERLALVTGAGSGFGRATVERFLGAGWRVIATMRRADERRDLLPASPRLRVLELDVTREEQRAAVAGDAVGAVRPAAGMGRVRPEKGTGAMAGGMQEPYRRVSPQEAPEGLLLPRALLSWLQPLLLAALLVTAQAFAA